MGAQVEPRRAADRGCALLVFLEKQLEGYLVKWEDDKIIRILKKAWGKMSERAQEAALNLPMSDHARSLFKQALS